MVMYMYMNIACFVQSTVRAHIHVHVHCNYRKSVDETLISRAAKLFRQNYVPRNFNLLKICACHIVIVKLD